ncbi:MAG: hypothetical protein M0R74_11160 [Dehalococcoidia bacterium]|jgi:hypothetical protein|nr:hypothetical protein [Dehalococcoidia bacterium]
MIKKNKKTSIQPSTLHINGGFRGGFEKSAGFLNSFVSIEFIKWIAVDTLNRIDKKREGGEFTLEKFLSGFS